MFPKKINLPNQKHHFRHRRHFVFVCRLYWLSRFCYIAVVLFPGPPSLMIFLVCACVFWRTDGGYIVSLSERQTKKIGVRADCFYTTQATAYLQYNYILVVSHLFTTGFIKEWAVYIYAPYWRVACTQNNSHTYDHPCSRFHQLIPTQSYSQIMIILESFSDGYSLHFGLYLPQRSCILFVAIAADLF